MWVLLLLPVSGAVFCKQCFNYNGQVCVSAPDCNGNYCLYEDIVQYSGVKTTKKTCVTSPYFQLPDGSYITNSNQCTTRNTNNGIYTVKICNDKDFCNTDCNSYILPTPPPYTLPPTTFPPIIAGQVQCFNCETFDGTDCRENICQGKYCLYLRQMTGVNMKVKKSCLQDNIIILDDGTPVQTVDVCEIRNTASSQYFVKMCNDQDFCNGYCNPDQQPPTLPPQRQPLVTCTCDGPDGGCRNGQCQANYCVFQREIRNGQTIRSNRGCSQLSYVSYPDNTFSTEINECEYKTINDITYQVKVCNNGNFCNTDSCPNNPTYRQVTCTQCEANNAIDCQGSSCTGSYCFYELQQSQTTGMTTVKKSCTISPTVIFADQSIYTNFNNCETRSISGVTYTLKLCNSSNFCNSGCTLMPTTTYYPIVSSSTNKGLLVLLFLALFL